MEFMINIELKKNPEPIKYQDPILLVGSCFTEHIGNSLQELKFKVLQNPHGILFDPESVCKSLISYIHNKKYRKEDLFHLNGVWHSWEHHSRFSHIDPEAALEKINTFQQAAHTFLSSAKWIIITLGSSFSYRLTNLADQGASNGGVANCHRAPAQWFDKYLLSIAETTALLDNCYHQLKNFNPAIRIIFTVSPVRHLRDGVIENNRSKARLIEAVHSMVNKFEGIYYFPAYELVIDVLRDYRFYDIDLTHPNYMATSFVLEKFVETCIDNTSRPLMEEIKKIVIARKHKAFQPATQAHQEFLHTHAEKVKQLMEKFPFLQLQDELAYFKSADETL